MPELPDLRTSHLPPPRTLADTLQALAALAVLYPETYRALLWAGVAPQAGG